MLEIVCKFCATLSLLMLFFVCAMNRAIETLGLNFDNLSLDEVESFSQCLGGFS